MKNMEEEQKLKCTFCNKSNDKLMLFSWETLNKSKIILKQRIIHNLKYKEVLLPMPDDLYDSAYHRECYKSFTALPKKYYSDIPD